MSSLNQYKYHIKIENINSSGLVIAELKKLNSLLTSSELLQMAFFNRAYLIITKRINQAVNSNYFDNPKQMEELEVAFAIRYFKALNAYVINGSLPGSWHKVNQGLFHKKHPASLSLLLGANAHINFDLPPVIQQVVDKPLEFGNDYFKINMLLKASAPDISKSYFESDEKLNFLKKNLRSFYLKPVMRLIIRWRTKAWNKVYQLDFSSV